MTKERSITKYKKIKFERGHYNNKKMMMLHNRITRSTYHTNKEGKSKQENQVSKSKSSPSLLVD
jgi:hypothetical protein